jgi:hypothetical protein
MVEAYRWWEKTVEYAFVRGILPDISKAYPLAGLPERYLSDLLESNEGFYRLIEFKRDEQSINHELRKYARGAEERERYKHYSTCIQAKAPNLLSMPGAKGHWLVLGVQGSAGMELAGLQYGALPGKRPFHVAQSTDLHSVSICEFTDYLLELIKLRSAVDTSSGRALVVAALEGQATVALRLDEFLANLNLAPSLDDSPDPPDLESSSLRM